MSESTNDRLAAGPRANRLGIALPALFLAVIAIVRPGRGRRLGVVAAIDLVLGTLVTVGMLVWRVVEANGS